MTRNFYITCICVVSMIALISAFGAEYFMDAAPCKLCILERYPYVALIILSLPPLFMILQPNMIRLILLQSALILIIGVVLSAYHVGVEQHFWNLPSLCHSHISKGATIQELLHSIMAQDMPSCDQVTFSILGLSMASWNLLLSIALLLFTMHGHKKLKEII